MIKQFGIIVITVFELGFSHTGFPDEPWKPFLWKNLSNCFNISIKVAGEK